MRFPGQSPQGCQHLEHVQGRAGKDGRMAARGGQRCRPIDSIAILQPIQM